MKKRFIKKLFLNKTTISALQKEEMNFIRAGSLIVTSCDCDTDSCSIFVYCCGPTTEKDNNNIDLDKGKG